MRILVLLLLFSFCNHTYWEEYGFTMGMSYSIVVELPQKNIDIKLLKKEIDLIFHFIEQSFSLYLKHSNIHKINQNQLVYLSEKEVYLYLLAQEICNKTNAYFFPFKKETIAFAKANQIPLKTLCNSFSFIKKDHNSYEMKKRYLWLEFDLNGIAKGYLVDLIKDFLISNNLHRYLIEVGGEICVGQPPSNQSGWKVAFEDPSTDIYKKTINSTHTLKNICLAASGNYLQDHIFNPYQSNLEEKNKTVIVFGPSCTIADAYATYIYVQPNYELYSKDYSVYIIQ